MFRRKLELELELTRGQVRDRDQTIQYLRQQIEQDRAAIRAWNEQAIELARQYNERQLRDLTYEHRDEVVPGSGRAVEPKDFRKEE